MSFSALPELGGGGGIRTPGSFRFNGFQDRRIRPLCHPSGVGQKLMSIGRTGGIRTPNRRFWRPLLYQLNYRPTKGLYPSRARLHIARVKTDYSTTSATRPDPIVRPPSRIAKVSPCSIATGLPSSTATVTRSPGITISMSPSSVNEPVTSVVLK